MRSGSGTQAKHNLRKIAVIQNQCLRRVLGAYRRTPTAALERESVIPPIAEYIETKTLTNAARTTNHQVEAKIQEVADAVWKRMRSARQKGPRPPTSREVARRRAIELSNETQDLSQRLNARGNVTAHATHLRPTREAALKRRLRDRWKAAWEKEATKPRLRPPATWLTPWEQDPRMLYAGLTKSEATALFLMRTEVIGLNAWLASVRVPGVTPACQCGWAAQTVRHVLLHCPRYNREDLLRACGTERLDEILGRPQSAAQAARWLIRSGAMEQFRVADEIAREDIRLWSPLQRVEEW